LVIAGKKTPGPEPGQGVKGPRAPFKT
jgi:hypothetical protein